MSVKRFDCIGQGDCSVEEFADGPFVRYEDYQKLESALERIATHHLANSMASEPEAEVLAGIARVALGRPHGLDHRGYAMKLWKEDG